MYEYFVIGAWPVAIAGSWTIRVGGGGGGVGGGWGMSCQWLAGLISGSCV